MLLLATEKSGDEDLLEVFVHVVCGGMVNPRARETFGKLADAETVVDRNALFQVFTANLLQICHQENVSRLQIASIMIELSDLGDKIICYKATLKKFVSCPEGGKNDS